jgi:hypothetical protein
MMVYKLTAYQLIITVITAFATRMREIDIRTIKDVILYIFIIMISPSYSTAISTLLTDKSYSINADNWTLKIVTKYFALK